MQMHWLDWTIVGITLAMMLGIAAYVRRYTRSVADFLAANRAAGRYLLTTAEGAVGMGALTIAATFEKFYAGGFGIAWWGTIFEPVTLFLALSGWVIYRYRQTRAMTMAQFFEMRYGRRFRIFAGIVAWGAGVLSYGIFPGVTARFLIYFCGIPQYLIPIGGVEINLTLAAVMLVMLSVALFLTFSGGQIAIMVTDFIQGQFFNITFLITMIFLLVKFPWPTIVTTLKAAPAGHSMLSPFKQSGVEDFNVWFILISSFMMIYSCKAWQNNSGCRAAAKSPHEAKMAGILAGWRGIVMYVMMLLAPVCAYVVLHNPDFAQEAAPIKATISGIAEKQLQKQMTVPIALTHLLPVGLMGLMAAALITASIATDDSTLHSWGSIFIQDVVLPIRNRPFAPQQHLHWLRVSILGVAGFGFFFSLLFPLQEYILMFLSLTHAVYLGGAGAAILGGLYWRRGTTSGAWSALITGSSLALLGIILRNVIWPHVLPGYRLSPGSWAWVQALPAKFPLNGAHMSFIAATASIIAYVSVSLASRQPPFNLDRMLHRGAYAPEGSPQPQKKGWARRLGMGPEFTRGDKAIYLFKFIWAGFWCITFLIGTIWGLCADISDDAWANWWLFRLSVTGVVCLLTIIWFLWGGIHDVLDLFSTLRTAKRSAEDDGTVSDRAMPLVVELEHK